MEKQTRLTLTKLADLLAHAFDYIEALHPDQREQTTLRDLGFEAQSIVTRLNNLEPDATPVGTGQEG